MGTEFVSRHCRDMPPPFAAPVNRHLRTGAELDVLVLTPYPHRPGDLDNRVKTLIDALTMPRRVTPAEIAEYDEGAPIYCLMEDDDRVVRMRVDARSWHEPELGETDALVVVTARVVPGHDIGGNAPVGNLFLLL